MASFNFNFNFDPIQAVGNANNRENALPGSQSSYAGKSSSLNDRRHTGRKQAFGELKNVLHNTGFTTPMKAPRGELFNTVTPLKCPSSTKNFKMNIPGNGTKSAKRNKATIMQEKSNRFDNDPCENLEYIWSQQSALTHAEIDRLLNPCDEEDIMPKVPIVSPIKFETVFAGIDNIPIPKDDLDAPPGIWGDLLVEF